MKIIDIKDFWYNLPQVIRYLFTGGYNFVVSYLIFAVLILLLTEKHSQICLILSYFISSFNSYFSQKVLVFKTKGNYLIEYLKCCFSWIIAYILNAFLLKLFFDFMGINIYISQFASLALVAIVTYFLFKHFSFIQKS